MLPFITIVMPVRNEARFIRTTIEQLLTQDYPKDRYEIVVADGMSNDGTREIVKEIATQHPQVRLLDNPKLLSSTGRNVGFRNGKGDLFMVVDGHCYIPNDQYFNNMIECFETSGAYCLGRPQPLDPPGLTTFQKAVALARSSKLGHGGDSLIYGNYEGYASPVSNGAAYRREVFEKVGYVDEAFDAAEDVEFNYRVEQAAFKAFTSYKLTMHYYPRENLCGLFRQMRRYGMGRYRFTRKHIGALTVNQLIPAGFVAGLPVAVIAVIWSFTTGFVGPLFLIILYALYIFLIVGESLRLATVNGKAIGVLLPIIFFVIHFGLGFGFILEAVRGLRLRAHQKTAS